MTRSGIKQGLAVSAVAALATVGLPAAAHAATAPTYTFTQSATSVSAGETASIKITAPDDTTAVPLTAGDVTAKETFPAVNGTTPAPATLTPTVSADTDPTAGFAQTIAVSAADAGTIAVSFVDSNGTNHIFNITVGGGKNTAADVKSLKTNSASFSLFASDLAGTDLTVRPLDSAGFGVADIQVIGSVDGGTATDFGGATATGSYDITEALSGLPVGNHVIKLWVDEANNGDTAGKLDADEPSATITVNVSADPLSVSPTVKFYAVDGAKTVNLGTDPAPVYPDYQAATVGLKLNVQDGTTPAAVAGVPVRFDIYAGVASETAAAYQLSLNGTTDASGNIVLNAPLTADQAKKLSGTAGLYVAAYVSKSSTPKVGDEIAADTVATFAPAQNTVSLQGGVVSPLQATVGSTVNINLVEQDQFGKAAAGHVFRVTGSGVNDFSAIASPNDRLAPTSASGQTTFTYTDKKASVGGEDTLVFTDLTDAAAAPITVKVDFVKSVTPASILGDGTSGTTNFATAQDGTVGATAAHAYSVVVKDADGNVLSNQKVAFTVDNGFVSKDANGKGSAKTVEVLTNALGLATAYAGSEQAGTQVVTATSGPAKALVSKASTYSAAAPYAASISGPAAIVPGQSAKFVVSVTDEFGNPADGFSNDLEFDQANSSVTGAGYIVSPNNAWTNYIGKAGTGAVIVGTASTDSGAGKLTVSTWANNWAPEDKDNATVSGYTKLDNNDEFTLTASYAVQAPVVTPPVVTPPVVTPPVHHNPAIKSVAGHSAGHRDVLVVKVANANGKRVIVKVHGHKVGHGVVKNGKAVIKVRDMNGAKKTRYQVIVAGLKKVVGVK